MIEDILLHLGRFIVGLVVLMAALIMVVIAGYLIKDQSSIVAGMCLLMILYGVGFIFEKWIDWIGWRWLKRMRRERKTIP